MFWVVIRVVLGSHSANLCIPNIDVIMNLTSIQVEDLKTRKDEGFVSTISVKNPNFLYLEG